MINLINKIHKTKTPDSIIYHTEHQMLHNPHGPALIYGINKYYMTNHRFHNIVGSASHNSIYYINGKEINTSKGK